MPWPQGAPGADFGYQGFGDGLAQAMDLTLAGLPDGVGLGYGVADPMGFVMSEGWFDVLPGGGFQF